jgi:hypothetical protein
MPDPEVEEPPDPDLPARSSVEIDELFTEARRRAEHAHELEREHLRATLAQSDARIQGLEAIVAGFLKASDERLHAVAALSRERDELRAEVETLRESRVSEAASERATAQSNADATVRDAAEQHAAERVQWQAEIDQLRAALASRNGRSTQLPVLVSDLARWSAPMAPRAPVARATPFMEPPTADDLATVDRYLAMLNALIQTPTVDGRPLHTHFDTARFQSLQTKLREAAIVADRLLAQVNRSKSTKDMLWHLMVAHRTDELRRDKRR